MNPVKWSPKEMLVVVAMFTSFLKTEVTNIYHVSALLESNSVPTTDHRVFIPPRPVKVEPRKVPVLRNRLRKNVAGLDSEGLHPDGRNEVKHSKAVQCLWKSVDVRHPTCARYISKIVLINKSYLLS